MFYLAELLSKEMIKSKVDLQKLENNEKFQKIMQIYKKISEILKEMWLLDSSELEYTKKEFLRFYNLAKNANGIALRIYFGASFYISKSLEYEFRGPHGKLKNEIGFELDNSERM